MGRRRTYGFIAWQEEGVWTAHSPTIPGVYGIGRTRAQAERDLADGVDDLFQYLEEMGERAPSPQRLFSGELEA